MKNLKLNLKGLYGYRQSLLSPSLRPRDNREMTERRTREERTLLAPVPQRFARYAAMLIMLLTIGVGQMWGYWYVPSKNLPGDQSQGNYTNQMDGSNKMKYYALPPGKYYFKLYVTDAGGSSTHKVISVENNIQRNGRYVFKEYGLEDGWTYLETQEVADLEIYVHDEKSWYCTVTASAPTYYIKYNWNNAGWGWSAAMTRNGDGTYSCIGNYGGNSYDYGRGNQNYVNGTNATATIVGTTPNYTDLCVFTLDTATNALTIRKTNTIATTNYIYFDNTESNWSETYKYFVVGRPKYADKAYRTVASMDHVDNTNLWRCSQSAWGDAAYYAVLGSNDVWYSDAKDCDDIQYAAKYSSPYTMPQDIQSSHHYVVSKTSASNNTAINFSDKGTSYAGLNFNLGYKYVIKDPSSENWVDMTSSHGNTPAQISMTSYKFNSSITTVANTTQTINANTNSAYSKSVSECAYRGNSNLSYSNLCDGYKFIGWYKEDTEKNTTSSYDFNPTEATTISARFEYRWSIKGTMLSQNWGVDNYITHFTQDGSGNDIGYLEIELLGNTSYEFKVADRADGSNPWYSCDGEDFTYTDDDNVAKTCTNAGGESNMTIHTAAPGSYRFTWNADTKQLTITYPTSYKVTYNDNGITSGSAPTDGDYYAPDATVTVLGDGTMVKSGYTFLNWNTEDHGYGTDYSAGNTFSITEDVTLYAKWQNDSYTSRFTFHDGTPSSGFAGTWNVTTFPASATRTELGTNIFDISYTIPNPATSPNFFVGYEGWAANPLGESSGQSVVKDWDDNFVDGSSNVHGYLKVLPGYSPLSDGSSKTAQGATGTLTIKNQSGSLTDNLQIGFTPNGYGLTISYNDGSAKTQVIAFHSTENPNLWETDVLDGGLDANKVAGTFKVGLATSSSGVYVDCYQSVAEAKAALDARKVTGTNDITSDVSGRFQILINSSATNFGLRYVPLENVWSTPTSGAYYWNNVTGWSLGRQPTIDEDVIIKKGITVNVNNARAKSIRIDKTESSDAQLRIEDTGALLVVENILSGKNGVYGATASEDINIYTGYSGNGALIVGGESYNTAASYSMYSKSYMYGGYGYINQYVGIPFTLSDRSYFYGAYLFSYDEEKDEWAGNVYNMYAFKAYNIIQTVAAPNGFYMYGTLNLPGIADEGGNQVLSCKTRTVDNAGKMDYLFANSWTAPIEVGAMDASDFSSNLNPTIYIFNAGAGAGEGAAGNAGGEGLDAGNFTAITAGSAGTIPSTQGFMVRANAAGSHTLTLNYKKHVYDPALAKLDAGGISTDPTRAPKRDRTADPEETKLSIRVKGESGFADRLRIRKRADFTNEFDNCFDATKAWGMDEAPQLYAKSGALDMAINAVPDVEGMIVGFRKGTVEDVYTMTFEYDGDETLYLNDLKEQVSILIDAENDYTFTTAAEDNAARFVISATPIAYVPTGIDLTEGLPVSGSHKFIINGQLYIIREGRKYNANGVLVK